MSTFLNYIRPIITDDQVRLGRVNDGGYVVNERSLKDAKLISLGINNDWSFEESFLTYSSNAVMMYDGSVSKNIFLKIFLVDLVEIVSLKFLLKSFTGPFFITYLKKTYADFLTYLSFKKITSKSNVKFFKEFVSNKANKIKLNDIIQNNYIKGDSFFLKIDIEGDEYRIYEDIIMNNDFISGMVIEFHDIDVMQSKFIEIIEALKKHFYITHIHANNYSHFSDELSSLCIYEISFINKRLHPNNPVSFQSGVYNKEGLDSSNNPKTKDFIIEF